MVTQKLTASAPALLAGVLVAAPALAQRDERPPQRTDHYKTPCTINSFPSWCAVSLVGDIPQSMKVEFAHGDGPIFTLLPISQNRDSLGALKMRELNTGQVWMQRDYGFSFLLEEGEFSNAICVGPGARLPYPRGCAKP